MTERKKPLKSLWSKLRDRSKSSDTASTPSGSRSVIMQPSHLGNEPSNPHPFKHKPGEKHHPHHQNAEQSQHRNGPELTATDKQMAKDNPQVFIDKIGAPVIHKSTYEIKTHDDEKLAELQFERHLGKWAAENNLPIWAQDRLRQQMKREVERRRVLRQMRAEKGGQDEAGVHDSLREKKDTATTIVVASGVRGITDQEDLDDQKSSLSDSSNSACLSFRGGRRTISRKTLEAKAGTSEGSKSHLPDIISLFESSANSDTHTSTTCSKKEWDPWGPISDMQQKDSKCFTEKAIKATTLQSTALTLLSPDDTPPLQESRVYEQTKKRPHVQFSNKCQVHKYQVTVKKVKSK